MEFLEQFGIFFAEAVTVVVAILVIVAGVLTLASKGKAKAKGKITIKPLNKHFDDMANLVNETALDKGDYKKWQKQQKQHKKAESKEKTPRKRIFVLDFHGDIKASAVEHLREEVTAILTVAKPEDEVVVKVESGMAMA